MAGDRSLPMTLSVADLPAGQGSGKVITADDLGLPGPPPRGVISGAVLVGYDDTNLPPLLGADDVQEAIDALKAGGGAGGAPSNGLYLTLGLSPGLSMERVFTPGLGLTFTDNGPNSTYVLDMDLGGAGVRQYRDPAASTATVYVRIGGNDNDDGATPATAFATLNRAVQETAWGTEYLGAFARTIDVGPGAFAAPDLFLGTGSFRLTGAKTLTASAVVDVTTPAVNPTVGNTLVLTGLAPVVADALIGQLVHFPAADVWARVDKNDATVGPLTTVVVVTEDATPNAVPAAGGAVDLYTIDTTFEVQDSGCTFTGGSHYYASLFEYVNWVPAPGTFGSDAIDAIGALVWFRRCNVATTLLFNGAGSEHIFQTCYITSHVWQYETSGSIELLGGNVLDGLGVGSPMCWGPGSFTATYENAVVRVGGAFPAFAMAGGFFYSDQQAYSGAVTAEFSTMRLYGVGAAFHANYEDDFTIAQGGEYRLPSFLPPYDVAGVQVPATVGTTLVDVRLNSHANVTLGANSSITIAGVLNPVRIGGVLRSADVSGTRITGGTPTPGPAGPGIRAIAATPSPLDPVTDETLAVATSVGVPVIDIPLPDVTTLTPGARYTVNWEVGQGVGGQDVTVTPVGGQKVRNTLGAFSLTTAGVGSVDLIASPATSNWLAA